MESPYARRSRRFHFAVHTMRQSKNIIVRDRKNKTEF